MKDDMILVSAEVFDVLEDMRKERDLAQEELTVMYGFLSYYDLEYLYHYFKENAHLEHDENEPFPRLVL
jgi:hypothetical protein